MYAAYDPGKNQCQKFFTIGEAMHIPKPYETFSKKYPDLLKKYKDLGEACRNAGPLEEKYQDLIKLGIAMEPIQGAR